MAISKIGQEGLDPSRILLPSQLPAGSVLQVVSATTSTAVTSSSSSFADTGLSATITPTNATSKILVICMNNGAYKTAGNAGSFFAMQLIRGANALAVFEYGAGYNNALQDIWFGTTGFNYLDSPETTSPVTYKTRFANIASAGTIALQGNSATSGITLLEIAA